MEDTFMDIREHGVCVNKIKNRYTCNYCGKEVQGICRLKLHLGGVGIDVTHCDQVASNVKKTFRSMVMKQRHGSTAAAAAAESETSRVVGNVQMGNGGHHKRGRSEISSSRSVVESSNEHDMNIQSNKARKCIGRFFYESGIAFSAVDSPSFREMIMSVAGGGGGGDEETGLKIPGSRDLSGWMLQEALKEVEEYVKRVKDSWAVTGCSILLDAWVDEEKGRDLVTFIADSPAGPVYLKSFDVSDIKSDTNALISLVEGVAEEVGVGNVVQIIACSTTGWVGELGKSFASNNSNVFWSVSISHCFELMLAEISKMDSSRGILDKVNSIIKFLRSNPLVWELFKDPSHRHDMRDSSSEFEFVRPYLTLENVLKAKDNLEKMFFSSVWSKAEGTAVSKLVNDWSFWESVERLVRSTSPLIRGLCLLSTANNQQVGYVYDTMDGIKESVAKELSDEELPYEPVWDVIDDVWNNHLHSPLHVTGYFLNPGAFYSGDFSSDHEVTTGFISSLVYMVKDCHVQAKISAQLKMYSLGQGCFDEASQANQITDIAPAEWWVQKASQHPELQSFAIKILSQTCEGASRYKLKRSVAEKLLLTRGMSHREKQHLEELAFVHYNLHLQRFKGTN